MNDLYWKYDVQKYKEIHRFDRFRMNVLQQGQPGQHRWSVEAIPDKNGEWVKFKDIEKHLNK